MAFILDLKMYTFFSLYVNPGNNNEQTFRTHTKLFYTDVILYRDVEINHTLRVILRNNLLFQHINLMSVICIIFKIPLKYKR